MRTLTGEQRIQPPYSRPVQHLKLDSPAAAQFEAVLISVKSRVCPVRVKQA
jgi:hypothetical protein